MIIKWGNFHESGGYSIEFLEAHACEQQKKEWGNEKEMKQKSNKLTFRKRTKKKKMEIDLHCIGICILKWRRK